MPRRPCAQIRTLAQLGQVAAHERLDAGAARAPGAGDPAAAIRNQQRIELEEKLRTEEALRKSEDRYRVLAEAAQDLIFVLTPDGRIEFSNSYAAKMTGMDPQAAVGRDIEELFPPEVAAGQRRSILKVCTTGQAVDIERLTPFPTGPRWLNTRLVPIKDAAGTVTAVLGIARDITERKAAEVEAATIRDQLAHVSRLASLGELATTMAHEVNQPLTAIAANAQASRRWMNQEPLDRTELTATLDDIAADALRAGAIIRRLRALVEKQPSEQRPVDLNTLVQDVVRLVAYDLPLKAITFRMDLAADLPAVTGDRVQLQQVLLNLLLNAIEAIVANGDAEGSKIELRTVCTDGGVAVEVADNGVGFDPARAATIFDPFVTTKAGGLGMGLSIGRTIAAAHGGRLWATRNAERGATFHLSLPVASSEPEDEQGRAANRDRERKTTTD